MKEKNGNNTEETNFPETYKRENGTTDGQVGLTEGRRAYFIKRMFWGNGNTLK